MESIKRHMYGSDLIHNINMLSKNMNTLLKLAKYIETKDSELIEELDLKSLEVLIEDLEKGLSITGNRKLNIIFPNEGIDYLKIFDRVKNTEKTLETKNMSYLEVSNLLQKELNIIYDENILVEQIVEEEKRKIVVHEKDNETITLDRIQINNEKIKEEFFWAKSTSTLQYASFRIFELEKLIEDANKSLDKVSELEEYLNNLGVESIDDFLYLCKETKEIVQDVKKETEDVIDVFRKEIKNKRDTGDNVFNGYLQVRSEHEGQGTGVFLICSEGNVRGQIVYSNIGMQITQYLEDGSQQTFTFPNNGGEILTDRNGSIKLPDGEGTLMLEERAGVIITNKGRNIKVGEDNKNWGSNNWGLITIGNESLNEANNVQHSIAVGEGSLKNTKNSKYNIAIGHESLHYAANGSRNIAIGSNSLRFLEDGYGNVALGRNNLQNFTSGYYNVALGIGSLTAESHIGLDKKTIINSFPNTSSKQTAVGVFALNRSLADGNIGIGYSAGRNVTNSVGVFIGNEAGKNVDYSSFYNGNNRVDTTIKNLKLVSENNVLYIEDEELRKKVLVGFILEVSSEGYESQFLEVIKKEENKVIFKNQPIEFSGELVVNVTKFSNNIKTPSKRMTLVGNFSGSNITDGNYSTFIGHQSGGENEGNNNTGIGDLCLNNSKGSRNSALGVQALNMAKSSFNTAVGYHAGNIELTNNSNDFFGNLAGTESPTNIINSSCIGNRSNVTGSNQVQIGNSDTITYVYGTVQNRSDKRDKANIKDLNLGLDLVLKLKPKEYLWNYREWNGKKKGKRKHAGFIAQEINDVVDPNEYAFVQDHSINGGSDVLSVGYDEFIPILTKAIQELNQKIDSLTEDNKKLKQIIPQILDNISNEHGERSELEKRIHDIGFTFV